MPGPPQKPFEIAIIGGGITGVTLAISLHRRNIRCRIYEQAAAFGEIGAGVGVHPNAIRAMRVCDPGILEAFNRVCTRNGDPAKRHLWFDFLDGTAGEAAPDLAPAFQVWVDYGGDDDDGHAAAHRARWLDEMVGLMPDGAALFDKRLENIVDDRAGASGKMLMHFRDGSVAEADAVIGCDGIKSRTRELMVGERHPQARCGYSHKYAYRGLMPMQEAVDALGEEKAANACLWMGPDRHVLTFPVSQGTMLNLVAFVTSDRDWPSDVHLTLPSSQEEALEDFEGFGPSVIKLIKMTKPDRWGLFDLANNPLSRFCNDRVCLVGDAAHASTPHHGAGAGFCIEDVAVLSTLLAADEVESADDLEAVFAAFDASRRERDQWLVQSSRTAADLYEWRAEGVGKDYAAIKREIEERQAKIWIIDVDKALSDARDDLIRRLKPA